jgi:alkanesulfonate monooxygenase SsuD/methylene tetrahydromethanopterin reductase-like flavin-dependent oxidoreductase (luciferase family)
VSRHRGFGVAGGLDPAVAAPLAQRVEADGYDSIWSNDTPIGDGLETLAAFAEAASRIELGVTLALDRHPPAAIAAQIDSLGLERERLWIAIGTGHAKRPLSTMRGALGELRESLGGVRLALAAMGPKMSALGGAEFDGVFLNWAPPAFAAEARERVHASAREAGREPPPLMAYVRTAVGPDAEQRLTKEESFYRELHDGYRRQFERLGAPVGSVGVAAGDREQAQRELAAYDALDVLVARGLASATVEAMTALADAAAPDGARA